MAVTVLVSASIALCLLWVVKIAYSVWWKPKQLEKFFKRQGIHCYPYKLLVGNILDMGRMHEKARSKPLGLSHDIVPRVVPFFNEAAKKYGRLPLTWQGNIPQLIVMDLEMIKEIFSNKFDQIQKVRVPPQLKPLEWGLVGLDGEHWSARRRLINPAFHFEKLKGMLPAFYASSCELVQKWERSIGPQGSCELDLLKDLQNFTGDVISRTAFGGNYEEAKDIFRVQREQGDLFADALWTLFIPGYRFLPTKNNRKMKELNREVKSILTNVVAKREKEMKLGIAKNDDLLGMLLESNRDEDPSRRMTRDEVIEECGLFYFGGQETSSLFITWTMILLSMNPSWQERMREEVFQVCGKSTPTWDNLNHLKIVNMVLHESLRLYPPAHFIVRETCKTLELGGITIPAGVRLLLPTLLIHHDHQTWGDDADEFKPERFSEGLSNAIKHQLAFFPFGWGPRVCIGQSFVLVEVKMVLAMILQRFSFELSPSYVHAPHTTLTLEPQYGAQIILHRL